MPWSSLGAADDAGPAVDPDRFRGLDDQWPRNWTPLGKPRPWPRSPEDEQPKITASLRMVWLSCRSSSAQWWCCVTFTA